MTAQTWPDNSSAWWWMRYKLKPRSLWRVVLVTRDDHEGCEFIRQHQDYNCYPQSFAAEWQATFVPASTPPDPVAFEIAPAAERPDSRCGRSMGFVSSAKEASHAVLPDRQAVRLRDVLKPHVLQLVIYAAFHRRTLRRAYKLGAIHPLESPGLLLDRLARRIDNQINNFARN